MRRKGYTLLEMVLVVGLLVIIAGLAYPVVDNMYASSRLNAASDTVRARWSEARSRAMEERRGYRFAVKDNSGEFRIAPETTEFWDDADESNNGSNDDQMALVVEGSLPDQVFFGGTGAAASSAAQEWRKLVVFMPDGSASEDVEVTFATQGSRAVTLKLRATTGCAVTAVATLPQRAS